MDLLRDFDIAVPLYKVATNPDGARGIAEEFGKHCVHLFLLVGAKVVELMLQISATSMWNGLPTSVTSWYTGKFQTVAQN